MQMSVVVWLAVAVGIAAIIGIVRIVRTRSGVRSVDAGSVSTQWLTEHRVSSGDGINR